MNRSDRMVVLRRRLGLAALLTLFVFLAAAPCLAQRRTVVGQDNSVTATDELKAAAVDSVSWAFNKTYVFEDVAKDIEKLLRRKLKRGEYDEVETIEEFAQQLTNDIREISDDEAFTLDWAIMGLEAGLNRSRWT